jgi:hypothetical protein
VDNARRKLLMPSAEKMTVLVYSDDRNTREKVRLAVGRRPAPELHGSNTWSAPPSLLSSPGWTVAGIDVIVLDGEAVPAGGMGIARQTQGRGL